MTFVLAGVSVCLLLWGGAIVVDLRGSRCSLAMYIRDKGYLSAPVNATLYLSTPKAERTELLPVDSRVFAHPIRQEASSFGEPQRRQQAMPVRTIAD